MGERGDASDPFSPRSASEEAKRSLEVAPTALAQEFAARMLDKGIYVIGFYYPVVPKGKARIRVQMSAAHDRHHLDKAIAAFIKVGKELKVIK